MRFNSIVLTVLLCLVLTNTAEARRKKRRKRYSGPPPTHPVLLWSRTLSESTDSDDRRVAAFKLSQYSLPIFQQSVVETLIKCMKDKDLQIKVLCTKALARASTARHAEQVRKVLLDQYQIDSAVRSTVVRVFVARKDESPAVHDTLLDSLRQPTATDDALALLGYFDEFGSGTTKYVDTLVELFHKNPDAKVQRAVVKAIGSRAKGQDAALELLSQCSTAKDTPLVLTCLSGMQLQGRKDPRVWVAVERTVESADVDVLEATLDVINSLPETTNAKISARLIEILDSYDDPDIQEKAVLALGICGDRTEAVVKALQTLFEYDETDESTRIASALTLGKQASAFPDKARELLSACASTGKTAAIKTACQLGLRELEERRKAQAAEAGSHPGSAAVPAATQSAAVAH